MVLFKCDLCFFWKLRGHMPDPLASEDELLMACIHRVNLDAFGSQAKGTVSGNWNKLADGLQLSELVGLGGPYEADGSLPKWDQGGYEVAIQMVLSSRRKGRYCVDCLQFDTIQKLRSCYSNQCQAAASKTAQLYHWGTRKESTLISAPTCALLFGSTGFWRGASIAWARIGDPTKQ
jgi:hypothetical protein